MHGFKALLCLAGVLLIAAAWHKTEVNNLVPNANNVDDTDRMCKKSDVYFTERDSLGLRIPRIGLETILNFAALSQGRIDAQALKGCPAWISPEARPSLCRIGQPGVALILGHRQWGLRPLVFARLDALQIGDGISIFNHDSALNFAVSRRYEITPDRIWQAVDDESSLALRDNRPEIMLLTCAPYGYNHHRLVVIAGLEG